MSWSPEGIMPINTNYIGLMLSFSEILLFSFVVSTVVISAFIGAAKIFNPFWPIYRYEAVEGAARKIYELDPVEGWSWIVLCEFERSGNPTAEYIYSREIKRAKAALEIL